MEEVVLGRLSGEITLKSPSIVKEWINLILRHIKKRLLRRNIKPRAIYSLESRIFIEPGENIDAQFVAEQVAKVFGIKEAIVAIRTPLNIESIVETAKQLTEGLKGTFAVRTNRAYKEFPYTSIEINRIVGEAIIEANNNLRVDLSSPDFTLEIEIRRNGAYIYRNKVAGFAGLPYGVSGKGVALVSGGIDSSLAAWLAMKRGMKVVVLHADMGSYYSEKAKNRAISVLKWLADWVPSGRLKAYIVPVANLHEEAKLPVNKYRCVFCKMLLIKLAELVAKREYAHAIITGESLSQVASQTPENLRVINLVTRYPILRPLIFMDKAEIDSLAQKIGLYHIVSMDVGKCRLVPRRPAVDTELEVAKKLIEILKSLPIDEAIEKANIRIIEANQ